MWRMDAPTNLRGVVVDDLKKQAEELGIDVDGRWGEVKLKAEIQKVLDSQAGQDPVEEPEQVVDPAPEEPEAPAEPEPEPEPEPEGEEEDEDEDEDAQEASVVITSLIENPMRVFGLTGAGSTSTFTRTQLAADKHLTAKLQRALDLGLIKAE